MSTQTPGSVKQRLLCSPVCVVVVATSVHQLTIKTVFADNSTLITLLCEASSASVQCAHDCVC